MIQSEEEKRNSADSVMASVVYQDGQLWVSKQDAEMLRALIKGVHGREEQRKLRQGVLKIYPTEVAWTLDKPLVFLYAEGSRNMQDNRWYWMAPFAENPERAGKKEDGVEYVAATEWFGPSSVEEWADAVEDAVAVLEEITDGPYEYLRRQIDTLIKDGVYLFASNSGDASIKEADKNILRQTLSLLFSNSKEGLNKQRKYELSHRLGVRLQGLGAGQSALGMPNIGALDAKLWYEGAQVAMSVAEEYGLLFEEDKCLFELNAGLHLAAGGLQPDVKKVSAALWCNRGAHICCGAKWNSTLTMETDKGGFSDVQQRTDTACQNLELSREIPFAKSLFHSLKERLKGDLVSAGEDDDWASIDRALETVVATQEINTAEGWLALCDGVLMASENRYDWDAFVRYQTCLLNTIQSGDQGGDKVMFAQLLLMQSAQPRDIGQTDGNIHDGPGM